MDIETGGFDSNNCAVCSITLKIDDIIKTWYIKPYYAKYNNEALKVNGLSLDFLHKKGENIYIVIEKIKIFLENNTLSNRYKNYLVGHNLQFDLEFIKKMFNIYDYTHYHYYDTMHIALFLRLIQKIDEKQKVNLVQLYKLYFGTDSLYKNAHSSEADVLMTEKLFKYFILKKWQ